MTGEAIVNNSAELLQLAHLLRVGADTALEIADIRQKDAGTIERLANQAIAMAGELEAIAASMQSELGAGFDGS